METILATTGLALMIGLSGIGSAIGLSIGGASVLGMIRKPKLSAMGSCSRACPQRRGFMDSLCLFFIHPKSKLVCPYLMQPSLLAPGLPLASSVWSRQYSRPMLARAAFRQSAAATMHFGKTMILAAFPEFYAILSLVAAILMKGLL